MDKLFNKFWKWLIWSALFALLIHCLFKIPAPIPFLEHVWSAGDILAYISTILLAWVAYWQNQRYKNEADKHQREQEMLTNEINEKFLILQQNIDRQTHLLASLENEKMVPYIRIGSELTRNGQGRHLTITGPEVSGFQTSTVHLKNIGINGISNIVCEKIIINDIPYEVSSSPDIFGIDAEEVCFLVTPYLVGETQTLIFYFSIQNIIGIDYFVQYKLSFAKGRVQIGEILNIGRKEV